MKVTNNIGLDLKAIQVDDYWIIVDTNAEINNNDYFNDKYSNSEVFKMVSKNPTKSVMSFFNPHEITDINKIIASTKFIDKSIPVIKFVEQSIEELAEEWYKQKHPEFNINERSVKGFIEGYNKAKSSDKKYTEGDIKSAFRCGWASREENKTPDLPYLHNDSSWGERDLENHVQSLNQSKLPETIHLEFEKESYSDRFKNDKSPIGNPETWGKRYKLKTTISTEEGSEIIIKF